MRLYFLFGTGRSGTTWLHELMSVLPTHRPIFEPFHPVQVPSAREFAHRYLRRDTPCTALEEYLARVCYSRTDDAWIRWLHMGIRDTEPMPRRAMQFAYNLPKVKPWARTRVVKFIHANLMVPWLLSHFAARALYVVRDPFDVVRSQMGLGWSTDLRPFLSQPTLVEDRLRNLVSWLDRLTGQPARLAASWAIQNLVALTSAPETKGLIVRRYEDLRNPATLASTMRHLGYTEPQLHWSLRLHRIREAIRSSRRRSAAKVRMTPEQRRQIQSVLDRFGIEDYAAFTAPFVTAQSP